MRQQLLLISTFLTLQSFGQCGREYPSGFYHNSKFVNSQGDTLNKLDSSGFYHGLHLYADNPGNSYSDTNSFIFGEFEHGLPVGEWKDHCKDGSFSVGHFDVGGGESSSDGKGGWITKKQGIYVKVGVWKYYDIYGNLLKVERYDIQTYKNGWIHKTYRADNTGNFNLTMYESAFRYQSAFRKEILREYSDSGVLFSSHYKNFWRDVSMNFYNNGQIKEKWKCRKILGIKINRLISKSYTADGKLLEKRKSKCWRTIVNESW